MRENKRTLVKVSSCTIKSYNNRQNRLFLFFAAKQSYLKYFTPFSKMGWYFSP